jgi:hypothetical protein
MMTIRYLYALNIRIAFGLSFCRIIPAGLILLLVLIIRIRLSKGVHQRAMIESLRVSII